MLPLFPPYAPELTIVLNNAVPPPLLKPVTPSHPETACTAPVPSFCTLPEKIRSRVERNVRLFELLGLQAFATASPPAPVEATVTLPPARFAVNFVAKSAFNV